MKTMKKNDGKYQKHPLYVRVFAIMLAVSMLLSSSGFQVLAEEAGRSVISEDVSEQDVTVLEESEAGNTSDQDVVISGEQDPIIISDGDESDGVQTGNLSQQEKAAPEDPDQDTSDMIENISEVADPAIVSGSVEAEGQTSARLEWQRDNIHVWAETENGEGFGDGIRLDIRTLDDLSDNEEDRQDWYDAYTDAAVTAYLQQNQIDEKYRALYKEAFAALVPFVPTLIGEDGQTLSLLRLTYTVQITNAETVRRLMDASEEIRIFTYDADMKASLLDREEVLLSVNEAQDGYASKFTTDASTFAVVKLDSQKLADAETRREADAATEAGSEGETETEAVIEGETEAVSESETEAVVESETETVVERESET